MSYFMPYCPYMPIKKPVVKYLIHKIQGWKSLVHEWKSMIAFHEMKNQELFKLIVAWAFPLLPLIIKKKKKLH